MSYQNGDDYSGYVRWYWNEHEQRGYYVPVSDAREDLIQLHSSLKSLKINFKDSIIGESLVNIVLAGVIVVGHVEYIIERVEAIVANAIRD